MNPLALVALLAWEGEGVLDLIPDSWQLPIIIIGIVAILAIIVVFVLKGFFAEMKKPAKKSKGTKKKK